MILEKFFLFKFPREPFDEEKREEEEIGAEDERLKRGKKRRLELKMKG